MTRGIFVKLVVFLRVNHCGPLPLRELHSTDETIVWRDHGGSWACLPPVYKYSRPATVCDTCGLRPKQHTKKRGALAKTLKKTKTTKEVLGRRLRSVWKRPKRKYSEWKEPYETLKRAKTLSKNNSWAEEGQRKSPKMNQSNWKGALRKLLWKQQSPTKC